MSAIAKSEVIEAPKTIERWLVIVTYAGGSGYWHLLTSSMFTTQDAAMEYLQGAKGISEARFVRVELPNRAVQATPRP